MARRNTLLVAHSGSCLLIGALAVACGSSSQARAVDASGGAANPAGGASTTGGGASAAGGASGSNAGGAQAAGGNASGGSSAGGNGQAGTGNPAGGANANGGAGGASSSGIRWLGRVDASNPAAVKFAWSGTGFVASVSGSKISVKLQAPSAAFFQPVIDGTVGDRKSVV